MLGSQNTWPASRSGVVQVFPARTCRGPLSSDHKEACIVPPVYMMYILQCCLSHSTETISWSCVNCGVCVVLASVMKSLGRKMIELHHMQFIPNGVEKYQFRDLGSN